MASRQTRGIILTGSVAAIAATGAWFGGELRTDSQQKAVIQKRREATPAEKIALLEQSRSGLVSKRMGVEKKIHELEMRVQGASRQASMVGRERRR